MFRKQKEENKFKPMSSDSDHTQYPDDFKPQEEYMYWVTGVWGSGQRT